MSIATLNPDQLKDIVTDAGMILKNYTPVTSGTPTVAESDIMFTTKGGVTISCTPTFEDFGSDIDNCPDNSQELKRITGWSTSIESTALNVSSKSICTLLGAASYDSTTQKITPRSKIELGTDSNNDGDYSDTGDTPPDFKDLWYFGSIVGGGYIAVKLKGAMNTSGFSLKTTKKAKGEVGFKLEGHPSVEDVGLVCPMEIYLQ